MIQFIAENQNVIVQLLTCFSVLCIGVALFLHVRK